MTEEVAVPDDPFPPRCRVPRRVGADPSVAAADWTAWSCLVRLVVTDPAALAGARAALVADLDDVDRACSRFRPDSELAAVETAAGRWVPVSPLLAELIGVALQAARRTDGDVDPTVGSALVALGYDRDIGELAGVRPDPEGVPAVRAVPGWQAVEFDAGAGRVRVPRGVHVDLGATAKAWTADRAAHRIAGRTGAGCLVSLGGDIAVAGPAPDGGWQVRVEDVAGNPAGPARGPNTVVSLTEGGLATSSTRARRWTRGGLALHHLLDPRTGLPPAPAWRTVSVAAGSCLDANTVSTAAVVRGAAVWPWLRRTGLPARLVTVDGQVLTAGGWPEEQAAA
jgi:thiamine biosynthesis lipoprotein